MTFVPYDHPEARAEYLDAVAHYEEQRAGLGDELIDRIEDAVKEMLRSYAATSGEPGVASSSAEPALRGVHDSSPVGLVPYAASSFVLAANTTSLTL